MNKREQVNDPNSCLNRAKDDEIIFVLLARDVASPETIRDWAVRRCEMEKNKFDDKQILEALDCGHKMEDQKASGVIDQMSEGSRVGFVPDCKDPHCAKCEAGLPLPHEHHRDENKKFASEPNALDKAAADRILAELERNYYQNIVFDVCEALEKTRGKKGIDCGTAWQPSREVQCLIGELLLERQPRQPQLNHYLHKTKSLCGCESSIEGVTEAISGVTCPNCLDAIKRCVSSYCQPTAILTGTLVGQTEDGTFRPISASPAEVLNDNRLCKLRLDEEMKHDRWHHSTTSVYDTLKRVLDHKRQQAVNAIANCRQFQEDVLSFLRAFELMLETVGDASTHGEKAARLRGLCGLVSSAARKVREAQSREMSTWSYGITEDVFRADYPVRHWMDKVKDAEARCKVIEDELAALKGEVKPTQVKEEVPF